MNILHAIAARSRLRARADAAKLPLSELRAICRDLPPRPATRSFAAALRRPGRLALICEIKKASPSKGLIAPDFRPLDIARDYAIGGADAISCLTEPHWFLGSDDIFCSVRSAVPEIPMLRKDFTISEYQLWQARAIGADAVLLIAAITKPDTLRRRLDLCAELGLDALVETRNPAEIDTALRAGAHIIGVNNRDLRDFSVDFTHAARLRSLVPPEIPFVAESGVTGPDSLTALAASGADAALVGEALMRSPDRPSTLRAFLAAARK